MARRSPKVLLFLAAFLAVCAVPIHVGAQTGVGLGGRIAYPRTDFKSQVQARGYGIVATSLVTGDGIWLSMTVGGVRFKGRSEASGEGTVTYDDVTQYDAMLGWGITVGPLRGGIRGGYVFGDEKGWSYMPVVGVAAGPVVIYGEWKKRGAVQWLGVSANIVR